MLDGPVARARGSPRQHRSGRSIALAERLQGNLESGPWLGGVARQTVFLCSLPELVGGRPVLHPEFPVVAPKPAPHGALGGCKFGGHLALLSCHSGVHPGPSDWRERL